MPHEDKHKQLQGITDAAREALGKPDFVALFMMPEPDVILMASSGCIDPREAGAPIERIGLTLQGRAPADQDTYHQRENEDGTISSEKTEGPEGLLGAIGADGGPISRETVGLLLEATRASAEASGRAHAYADCLKTARERCAEKETELAAQNFATDYAEQMLMGEIMALRVFVDAFSGAPDHYNELARDGAKIIAKGMIKAGLLSKATLLDLLKKTVAEKTG